MKGENKSVVHTLKLGGLYLDDKPVYPGMEYQPGQAISFGATASDSAISWVPVNGMLIADRSLLTNISWDDLDAQGLVFGREINIQGFRFKIRLLKVGTDEGVPNEWDAALDAVGEDDALWHWKSIYFWGQESVSESVSLRARRGCFSARHWGYNTASSRSASLGFRSALEPLTTDPSALRHGQTVLVIGHDGAVVGDLEDMTPYDFIIRSKSDGLAGKATFAANMRDGAVAVDRGKVVSITSV